jgi:hypothetical protein
MSISIHLSGRLKEFSLLPELLSDVAATCEAGGWEYDLVHASDPYPLEGIWFMPTGCDTISLTFTSDGKICHASMPSGGIPDEDGNYIVLAYSSSAGIQGIKAAAHLSLVQLFRKLKEKYFSEFQLIDEGNYWETQNDDELLKHFEEYDQAVKDTDELLKHMRENTNISINDIAGELKAISERIKGNN